MMLADKAEERFWPKVNIQGEDECWEWEAATSNGYGQFSINRREWRGAHRVSWFFDTGVWPESELVLHVCDNRACVNPQHLYLGDASDNMGDAVERQQVNQGARNGQAKMTENKVKEARQRYSESNVTQHELALEYGVSQAAMGSLLRGETWGHA